MLFSLNDIEKKKNTSPRRSDFSGHLKDGCCKSPKQDSFIFKNESCALNLISTFLLRLHACQLLRRPIFPEYNIFGGNLVLEVIWKSIFHQFLGLARAKQHQSCESALVLYSCQRNFILDHKYLIQGIVRENLSIWRFLLLLLLPFWICRLSFKGAHKVQFQLIWHKLNKYFLIFYLVNCDQRRLDLSTQFSMVPSSFV